MTNAFATYFAQDPEATADLIRQMGSTGRDFEARGGDVAGGDFGTDLFNFIKEFLLKDKELIEKIISKLLGL